MAFYRYLLSLVLATVAQASLQIVPGATWTAANTGTHVQAHGAGVFTSGGTYYLIGEDHTGGSAYVNCYLSTDLVEWNFVQALITQQSSGDFAPGRVVERPKVIYNSNTKQYVMYMHIDSSSYGEAKVGVATSSSVCGTYTYRGSFNPLGNQSRDMNLFQDDDGSAYLLSEDRPNGLRILKLSSDYLSVASSTYLFPQPGNIEAPAMIKKNGIYYLFGSHLHGWDFSDNVYTTASSLAGPWTSWNTFATVGSDTYDSQTNYILAVGNNVMYMGDRWVSTALDTSTYVWLPLSITGTTVSMANHVNWLPSTFQAGPTENEYEGESAVLSNGAKSVACSGCSGSEAAGYIGGPSGGTAAFNSVQSSATTKTSIRIKYENGDTAQRYADVTINGVTQRIAFLPTADGSTPGSSVVNANLKSGTNTITISGYGTGYGADVDRLMVPVS